LDRFLWLFEGNPDVIGSDHGRGHEKPGPLPISGQEDWLDALRHHLAGDHGIGVYPYWRDHVRWGCIDFDIGDEASWGHAVDVATLLHEVGITAWPERSRSKGYHVWIFSPEWQPAALMRRALLASCQIVNAPSDEINPKSERLEPGQIGNYVRLPYKGGSTQRYLEAQVVVDFENRPLTLDNFLERCEPDATWDRLDYLAEAWEDPIPVHVARFVDNRPTMNVGPESRSDRIRRAGPQAGRDRSSWLHLLAMVMGEEGHTYDEILEAVRLADQEHTHKYTDRHDAERRYADLARRAVKGP
jgi:hypothetical protein